MVSVAALMCAEGWIRQPKSYVMSQVYTTLANLPKRAHGATPLTDIPGGEAVTKPELARAQPGFRSGR
jgi:hypothetical protein